MATKRPPTTEDPPTSSADSAEPPGLEEQPGAASAARQPDGPRTREPKTRHSLNQDAVIISLAAKGLTNSQISGHLAEAYDAMISPDAVATVTDRILAELGDWQTRPLDELYPVLFIDAMVVKIRGGKTANRPVHTAIGVTLEGTREILGLWIADQGEGAKYWHQVLTELQNRGIQDVCFLICDGLRGLPDAANAVWPQAIVQTCVVHLIRNTFRYASHNDQPKLAQAIRPIYTAPNEAAARDRLTDLATGWNERYPAIIRLWEHAWPDFVPFLDYSPDIRELIYTTNAIENLHSQLRRTVQTHGYFHTEETALKTLYLAIRSFDPAGENQRRWSNRWKTALNAFALTFEDRIHVTY